MIKFLFSITRITQVGNLPCTDQITFQQEYRIKVILSIMSECKNDSTILDLWQLKFSEEMINPENCLDVVLFLRDCHRSIQFIERLKKLGSGFVIQHWMVVRKTKRWTDLQADPVSLVRIFQSLQSLLQSLNSKEYYDLGFINEKYVHVKSEVGAVKRFFDLDLIILHDVWVQANLDFKSIPGRRGHWNMERILSEKRKLTVRNDKNCCPNNHFFPKKIVFTIFGLFVVVLIIFWMCQVTKSKMKVSTENQKFNFVGCHGRCICTENNKMDRFCSAGLFF